MTNACSDTYLSLHGTWRVAQVDGNTHLDGQVPGLVHHDLVEQDMVPDPFYGMNEVDQQWVGDSDWEYSRTFELTREQVERSSVILDARGLDTVASVFINDQPVGTSDNMFVNNRWNVKPFVRAGTNRIRIEFLSARRVSNERFAAADSKLHSWGPPMPWFGKHRVYLRKCQCHSGWDWGPCFLVQGIWRDLGVECRNGPKLLAVTHRQEHGGHGVRLTVRAILDVPVSMTADVTFRIAGQSAAAACDLEAGEQIIEETLSIPQPDLWWPNGLGDQPLYELTVTVKGRGETDRLVQRIGFRTIELVREPDDVGESFFFRVNGKPVFAKGANWIPGDSFDSRLTDGQIEWDLDSAAAAHHNMIRVWGGGIYERDRFYERCDELGLMVWQDFMFACADYPADEAFLSSVAVEARQQVRRLMHHPSIALWCGNNEIQEMHLKTQETVDAYDKLFMQTIMPIVGEEDPDRTFWPSSPCNGYRTYGKDLEGNQTRGDMHYWGVWHGDAPFTEYLNIRPRFASEFGFQSFSSPALMDGIVPPEQRNIASEHFEFHQRSHRGNTVMLSHLSRHFRIPVSHEGMLYASQVLQALSIKTACEHWRRCMPHTMGTLIWQLNDIWPVASWSSLEADGGWKLLHYEERRFFCPVLLSMVEKDGTVEVWLSNDRLEPQALDLCVELKSFDGDIIWSRGQPGQAGPVESKQIAVIRTAECYGSSIEASERYLKVTAGDACPPAYHVFRPYKYLHLRNPDARLHVEPYGNGYRADVTVSSFAPFVWLTNPGIPGLWSDNGMHLEPGRHPYLFVPRDTATTSADPGRISLTTLWNASNKDRTDLDIL